MLVTPLMMLVTPIPYTPLQHTPAMPPCATCPQDPSEEGGGEWEEVGARAARAQAHVQVAPPRQVMADMVAAAAAERQRSRKRNVAEAHWPPPLHVPACVDDLPGGVPEAFRCDAAAVLWLCCWFGVSVLWMHCGFAVVYAVLRSVRVVAMLWGATCKPPAMRCCHRSSLYQ